LISREDVQHVALLSRLEVTAEEIEVFTSELNAILSHVEELQRKDVSNVQPLFHPLALENVLREDEPRASLSLDAVLSNAPEREDDGFRVPPVIAQH
jgi:aspartyl-tRNA(Asn)/glutamyl-tRNA(Gln) amidotransferase subunit C